MPNAVWQGVERVLGEFQQNVSICGRFQTLSPEGIHGLDALGDWVVQQQPVFAAEDQFVPELGVAVEMHRIPHLAVEHLHAEFLRQPRRRPTEGVVVGNQQQGAAICHPFFHQITFGGIERRVVAAFVMMTLKIPS